MESSIAPIGNGEVLLHVGVHKTGTTALQVALSDSRALLEEHGVRYPGKGQYHHKAILAGAERPYGWRGNGARITPKKHWNRLLKEVDYPGRVIISSEFLDDVKPEVGARIVEQLGGTDRVSVAVTLRSIGSILPSAWQQQVKSGMTIRYEQWLEKILSDEPSSRSDHFWWRHDQVAQVQRWADIVGPDRTYAIVIAEGDRNAIFNAFEGLLGLPQNLLAERQGLVQNRSMTAAEAEFVRRLNKELVGQMSWDEFSSIVRRGLVLNMVENRAPGPDEAKVQTPKWAALRAAELGKEFADGLSASDVNVIGDPQALAAEPRSGEDDPQQALDMDAAVAAAVGVVNEALGQRRQLVEQAALLEKAAEPVPTPQRRWSARGVARAMKRGVSG
jgi:hypothetical protein